MFVSNYASPIGNIEIKANNQFILHIIFSSKPIESNPNWLTLLATEQLDNYFTKSSQSFNLPLDLTGTYFQKKILGLVSSIPFGQTITYGKLSELHGNKKAIRAVAAVNAKNKFAIVIPCHRVLGAAQKLTGYVWGLDKKEWLLTHENAISPKLFS